MHCEDTPTPIPLVVINESSIPGPPPRRTRDRGHPPLTPTCQLANAANAAPTRQFVKSLVLLESRFCFFLGHEFTHATTRPPVLQRIKYAAKPRPNTGAYAIAHPPHPSHAQRPPQADFLATDSSNDTKPIGRVVRSHRRPYQVEGAPGPSSAAAEGPGKRTFVHPRRPGKSRRHPGDRASTRAVASLFAELSNPIRSP
jgi:hypothetical protein